MEKLMKFFGIKKKYKGEVLLITALFFVLLGYLIIKI